MRHDSAFGRSYEGATSRKQIARRTIQEIPSPGQFERVGLLDVNDVVRTTRTTSRFHPKKESVDGPSCFPTRIAPQ